MEHDDMTIEAMIKLAYKGAGLELDNRNFEQALRLAKILSNTLEYYIELAEGTGARIPRLRK